MDVHSIIGIKKSDCYDFLKLVNLLFEICTSNFKIFLKWVHSINSCQWFQDSMISWRRNCILFRFVFVFEMNLLLERFLVTLNRLFLTHLPSTNFQTFCFASYAVMFPLEHVRPPLSDFCRNLRFYVSRFVIRILETPWWWN